jgi:hypothetical protein
MKDAGSGSDSEVPVMPPQPPDLETDDRFPSGPWQGYFLESHRADKGWMELELKFQDGQIRGEGRDRVGMFILRGTYQIEDGRCHWAKRYIGKHDVLYAGYNEGRGIWGTWEITDPACKGGFHIWPIREGASGPELDTSESVDLEDEGELVGVGVEMEGEKVGEYEPDYGDPGPFRP